MKSVVFTYFMERDSVTTELEIEARIAEGFRGPKLVRVEAMSMDGQELTQGEIEDLTEELGEEALEELAVAAWQEEYGEGESAHDSDSLRIADELGIKLG